MARIDPLDETRSITTLRLSLDAGVGKISAYIQVPHQVDASQMAPLVALHGISRKASAILSAFGPECARLGRVLIVPRFSRRDWPHFQTIGRKRADLALLALLNHVALSRHVLTKHISLFGYSGGAQLAHRFAMLYPQRVNSLHVAAAGWYCLPDHSAPFPMGLGQPVNPKLNGTATLARHQLRTFLRLPKHVYVGADDTSRDPALRRDPLLEAHQGLSRASRARCYATSLRLAAEARGIEPKTTFTELPGCAHDFSTCADAGLTRLVCAQ